MAKNNKKSEQAKEAVESPTPEVVELIAETDSPEKEREAAAPEAVEVAPTPEPVAAPEPAKPAKEPQKLQLQDAARRFVVGFKDHWLSSIAGFAKSRGFSGSGTEEECKEILKAWGAKLK